MIKISIEKQKLELFKQGKVVKSYKISSGKNGIGFENGSNKTPIGKFRICQKIGEKLPFGAIFQARKFIGEIANINPSEGNSKDLITSRILWLDGCESRNSNTKDRFIYIHGTQMENKIGFPVSHGCIRMKNSDIIELFDLVEVKEIVEIFF